MSKLADDGFVRHPQGPPAILLKALCPPFLRNTIRQSFKGGELSLDLSRTLGGRIFREAAAELKRGFLFEPAQLSDWQLPDALPICLPGPGRSRWFRCHLHIGEDHDQIIRFPDFEGSFVRVPAGAALFVSGAVRCTSLEASRSKPLSIACLIEGQ